jgi:dTDP-4-amino-4,6-dideoxygalactose transaminase
MLGFMELAGRYGVKIIEDSAHALPAKVGNIAIGCHGSSSTVFSFYANKTITTGEGGMLVTSHPEIAARAKIMRLHGFNRDAFSRFSSGNWRYDIVAPGYKYNMTDIAGAMGLHQLRKADMFRERRAAISELYRRALCDLPIDFQSDAGPDGLHSWHLFVIRLRSGCAVDRDTAFDLLMERGIRCSVHYLPLHTMTYWRDRYALRPEQFPNSALCGKSVLSLPLFVNMSNDEVEYVIASVRAVLLGSPQ